MGETPCAPHPGVEPSAALAAWISPPRAGKKRGLLGIEPYESIAAAVAARHFDAAFVCTAPLTHAGIIGELLDAGLPVFTELNLVDDGYDALIAKPAQKGLPLIFEQHYALPRRNAVHQAPGGGVCKARQLHLPHRAVSAGLAPMGKL